MTVKLEMRIWDRDSDVPANRTFWRIGTADYADAKFPSEARVRQLFGERVSEKGDLVVRREGTNNLIVHTAIAPTPARLAPFLGALGEETVASSEV